MSIQDHLDSDLLEFTVKDDHANDLFQAILHYIENLPGEAKVAELATYMFNDLMKMDEQHQSEFIRGNHP